MSVKTSTRSQLKPLPPLAPPYYVPPLRDPPPPPTRHPVPHHVPTVTQPPSHPLPALVPHSSSSQPSPLISTSSPSSIDATRYIELYNSTAIDNICEGKLTSVNYYDKITNYLAEMGININIQILYSILTSKHIVNWYDYIPRIKKEGKTFRMMTKDKELVIKNLTKITRGSFNIVYTGDTNLKNFKKVIIRTTVGVPFDSLHDTIYENLKHIILYLINRCNINKNYQLIPQPIFMGILKKPDEKYYLFFIMEKGDYTLDSKISSLIPKILNNTIIPYDKMELRKLIYSFYKSLILFNEHLFYFAHNDSKFNNAIIKDGKIMLIDFGYTSFKLFDLVFNSSHSFSNYYSLTDVNLNAVQDLCQMLYSFYVLFIIYFKQNKSSRTDQVKILKEFNDILNVPDKKFIGYNLYWSDVYLIFREKGIETDLIWKQFYHKNFTKFFGTLINNNIYTDYISPDEMKRDYEITDEDETLFNNFYYTKYLKYKNKYLQLKLSN
ncbi:hypothetical protein crov132 [Cafeteria roenbergensis virus]|uniref:Protein kinase domain-containing protein n=1 Tax=Cafeteria roenbergensis virus (strain BV-PW1) TaxID=693272 RepID=E3T4Q2_CROVB|nr:hypothetical protein crov132 [Cafeteria roenbergensis virus BV-PW1]ADO67165.1 hypothetical protein crov132 [Cafeteria roenbergensis virus BV-PW1]